MCIRDRSLQDIAIYGIGFKFSMLIILGTNALKLSWQPASINFIGKKGGKEFYWRIFDYYLSCLGIPLLDWPLQALNPFLMGHYVEI